MMKFKCKIDHYFIIIIFLTVLLLIVPPLLSFIFGDILAGCCTLIPFLLIFLMFISSASGYVLLKDDELYIRYGWILRKSIPYSKIIRLEKKRKWYTESIVALKNSFEHVDIRYNRFDVTCVSVKNNDLFIEELNKRIQKEN